MPTKPERPSKNTPQHPPCTAWRTAFLVLGALGLASLSIPLAQAAVTSSSSHSPASPLADDVVTLTYTKSKALLDPDQTGSVTPQYTGPTSGSLAAKPYSLTGPPAGSTTLTWTLTASYAGSYTVTFVDTPTAGTRLDRSEAFDVSLIISDSTYYTGALSENYRFVVSDLGNNGVPIAVGYESNQLRSYQISGGTATPTTISSTLVPAWYGLDYVDITRDGKLDLVVGIDAGDTNLMRVYSFNGGTFSYNYGQSGGAFRPSGVGFVAKLDSSNTIADYVTPGDWSKAPDNGWRLVWQKDSGGATPLLTNAPWVTFESGSTANTGFALVNDYDADGKNDILVVRNQALGYLHNQGGNPPTFTWVSIANLGVSYYFSNAKWVDFDADGKPDLLLSSASATFLCFSDAATSYSCNAVGPGAEDVDAADFNQDGRSDIVLPSFTGAGGLKVLLNPGSRGGWTTVEVPLSVCCAHGLKVFDLDGDGKPDVLYVVNGDIHGATMRGFPPVGPVIVTSSQVYDAAGTAVSANWGTWNGAPGSLVSGTNLVKASNQGSATGTVSVSLGTFTCSCGPALPIWTMYQFESGYGATPPASYTQGGYVSTPSASFSVPAGQTVWIRYDVQLPSIVRDGVYTAAFTIA